MLMILRYRMWAWDWSAWERCKKKKNNPRCKAYACAAISPVCLVLLMWIWTRANRSFFFTAKHACQTNHFLSAQRCSMLLNPVLGSGYRWSSKLNDTGVWTSLWIPGVGTAVVLSEDFTTSFWCSTVTGTCSTDHWVEIVILFFFLVKFKLANLLDEKSNDDLHFVLCPKGQHYLWKSTEQTWWPSFHTYI